ncbi:hypothetical protein G7Z17_g7401 [Cylindrodendrum hubeiense]|uniref:Xylanolytic transcriptional activator regulatory domain-containing protein n=1 Tax=Cylindrodendrum hubeiense TaxID=595255 RepID=A0A9P5L7E5_9HYPO|nr:hypothetical protein G7Z17_g7401 [Cylindrodendrum hubeiense]
MITPTYSNNLLRCITSSQVCKSFGIKVSPNAQIVQVARHAGFDSLFIDLEHAWLTLAEASNLCNVGHLAGITPFVRVPHQCGNGFVQRVLDGGAMGVVFPHIQNAEEAKAAVSICKYPPQGCRSMTGIMPLFNMKPTPISEAVEFGNKYGSTVFAMIESGEAVKNVAEIAAVDGVDVLLVGSNDLCIDMGVAGDFESEAYRSSLKKVSDACKTHNKVFGVAGVYDDPKIHDWFINTLGARFLLVQQDLSLIAGGGHPLASASRLLIQKANEIPGIGPPQIKLQHEIPGSVPDVAVSPFTHADANEPTTPNRQGLAQGGGGSTQNSSYGHSNHSSNRSISAGLEGFGTHNVQGIPAESSLSSSNAFGSKVQDLLIRSGTTRSDGTQITTSSPGNNNAGTSSLRVTAPTGRFPQLPLEEEAYRLLEAVNFYLGQTQTHFDQRELSDRVGLLYANINDPIQAHDLWYMEMIIILAIGKLFTGDFDDDGTIFPGTRLFEFAHQNFPSISVHYAHGRLGVEVHALMAMYLQMVDRKEEAYLYISTALRLAVLHGYHQKATGMKMLRSERVQLNRLWWTIYMQERRLAAATGKPSGINDDMIDLPLPSDSGGFPPSAPLRANVKIARITGQVITVLYGPPHRTEDDFATLLTIRPLMLHVAQLILGGSHPNPEELHAGTLGKLFRTCSEAARRLLKAIIALKNRNLVAIFGFFDCDATFSAAFIMLLTMIFDSASEPDQRINPTPGLREAMDILQHLAGRGNTYAIQRFQEVQSVWNHLSTILEVPQASISTPQAQDSSGPDNRGELGDNEATQRNLDGHEQLHASTTDGPLREGPNVGSAQVEPGVPMTEYQSVPWDTGMWNSISDIWLPPVDAAAGENAHVGNLLVDPPIEDYYNHYQSLLNDPDWALTGQDVGDFAELRKHVLRFNS